MLEKVLAARLKSSVEVCPWAFSESARSPLTTEATCSSFLARCKIATDTAEQRRMATVQRRRVLRKISFFIGFPLPLAVSLDCRSYSAMNL